MAFSRARSQAVGVELKRRRERAGVSGAELARNLNWSQTKVTNMERGYRSVSRLDAARFLAFCREDGAATDELLDLFRVHDGYWIQPHDLQPRDELLGLVALETTATRIDNTELNVVPGLLQTEDYAEALFRMCGVVPDDDIESRVQARQDRQALLCQELPPRFRFFIHENALRTVVGSARVMNEQLLHLVFAASRPHIVIRIIPASVGAHAGLDGPFRLLEYEKQQPIAYLEHAVTSLFLDTPDVVRQYRTIWTRLEDVALTEEDSRQVLLSLASEYDQPQRKWHPEEVPSDTP
jgi:transcriptional regulator with XRE-family HTH domain